MDKRLKREIDDRLASGQRRLSLQQFVGELLDLGYRLDRSCDATCNARWMTGERAGETYPCRSVFPVDVDTKLSAFHVDANKDKQEKLQKWRHDNFAVSNGYIVEV